jgi:pyruvate/2-oxoglutarate dehydrogenase complex dihydrolipoamide acyltransferase (E2) component
MATDIVMPRLSDSMEEGTVLTWMKKVGDEVALGEELVEIETDKANMVFESDAAGTLIEIVAGEGDTLPIGEVIARVGEAGEAPVEPKEGGGVGAPIGIAPQSLLRHLLASMLRISLPKLPPPPRRAQRLPLPSPNRSPRRRVRGTAASRRARSRGGSPRRRASISPH